MTTRDFLQLELKLIKRNIRPKILLCFSIMAFTVLYSQPKEGQNLLTFVLCLVATGCFATYSQFWIGWDASYFEFLMSIPDTVKPYLVAKFFLNFAYVLLMTLIFLPFAYANGYILYLIVGSLYNASVSTYVMLYAALYNTGKLNLWKSEILFEGIVGAQYLGALIYFGLPIALILGCNYFFIPKITSLVFGSIGLIFLMLYEPIINILVSKFIKRKKMLLESYNAQ
jgi:hypothetical protein